jgi:hypothetical protein
VHLIIDIIVLVNFLLTGRSFPSGIMHGSSAMLASWFDAPGNVYISLYYFIVDTDSLRITLPLIAEFSEYTTFFSLGGISFQAVLYGTCVVTTSFF